MAWPRTLPSYDPNPPRPPGEIPQLEVPGLKIVQAYQPGQTFGRSATANAQPFSAIVSHYTGGENLQSALSTAKGDPGRGGVPYGYHFVIDKDGTVYQTAPLDARTNHVMPPGSQYRSDRPDISNNNAMGISFVGGGENPTPAALEAARKLYPAVQQRFNIPSQNIVGHGEIQAKGKDSRAADEGMTIVKELRGQPPTQTAQAAPKAAPGKPLGDTMTGGPTVTPTQAFSPTPTSAVAGSPAQQAITGAINPQPSFPTGNVGPQATGANPAMYLPGNRNMNTGQGGAPFYQVPAPPFQPAQAPQAAPQAPPTKAAPAPAQAAPQPEIPTRVYPGQQSTNYPDQRLPPSVGTGTGTVPLPYQRPAGAGPAVPADQKPASARAPAAAPQSAAQAASAPPSSGLGNQMPVAGGYVDPNTGRQIVNPSGSGEQAMGLTRDIGPAVPARPAPAQTGAGNRNTPSGKPVRPPPTGPVPPAPDAAGRLAKPENMPAPEQTLKTLDASRQKPNTLTGLYGSQTPPTNPPQGATFRDIANAPPAFGGPKGSTLTDLPLPPYNVGGPGGTPLPPPRPNFGPDSGAPVARNYLRPGPAATPQEQAQQDAARATEQRYAAAQGPGPATAGPPPAPQPPGPPGLGDRLGAAIGQFSTAPYSPGFLRQTGPAATPAEQATRDQSRAAELARSSGPPGGSPAIALPQGSPAGPPRNADQFGGPGTPPGLAKAMMDAVSGGYKPGFLDQTGPAATPQEQTMRGQGQAATAGLPFVQPPSPPPPSAGAPGQPGMPPGPQNQSMLPPWQQQQQLPLSPFYSQGLPGQGWPNWQNFDTSFSGGNMGDFGGFGGGGGFAGSEGFAFTPG